MTYALRGTCGLTAHALAAPMAPVIALMALAALGLSGYPVHEPVHARWPDAGLTLWVTIREQQGDTSQAGGTGEILT
jgi:hypothetical protein